ncbi:hypothetical protein [Nonomuraea sp. NPDC001699]
MHLVGAGLPVRVLDEFFDLGHERVEQPGAPGRLGDIRAGPANLLAALAATDLDAVYPTTCITSLDLHPGRGGNW